jgi:folylpolyglutamate synthase/dihydropteroate synthase
VLIEAEPSSYGGEFIANESKKVGISASGYDSIDEALFVITKMETEKARIIVCGSLYLAGDILYQNQKFCRN